MWHCIEQAISEATDSSFTISDKFQVNGGDTHPAFKISDGKQVFFVKLHDKGQSNLFDCEAYNLSQLAEQTNICTPKVITSGATIDKSFLVLEYISLKPATDDDWYRLGSAIAEMHKNTQHGQFGWQDDNYIGLTLQPNNWSRNWRVFFAEQRIGWQLQLLNEKSIILGDIEHISNICHDALLHHQVFPSLLHGDLWQGNIGFTINGPVIFDPACYYGDREADIAMTELFGTFPQPFYQGYQVVYPLSAHYEQRKLVYNFYHILNHANLFGGTYIDQAKAMLQRILALN